MFSISILSLDTEEMQKTVVHEEKLTNKAIAFAIETSEKIAQNHTDFIVFINHIRETENKKMTLTFQYEKQYVFESAKITANIDDAHIYATVDCQSIKILLNSLLAGLISDMLLAETTEDAVHAFSVTMSRLFVVQMCGIEEIADEERLDHLAYCLTENRGNGYYIFSLNNRSFQAINAEGDAT